MSLVLGLDTATDDTSVAVIGGAETVFERCRGPEAGRPLHGPALLEMVEEAVEAAGGWQGIGRIAVGTGPGTFTGLRVGIATAKALARSTGASLSGVCSLDALALGAAPLMERPGDRLLCALDARRGQVFAALYGPRPERPEVGMPARLVDPFVSEPGELGERLPARQAGAEGRLIAVGSGALRFKAEFEAVKAWLPEAASPYHHLSARCTALIGDIVLGPIEPIYLRPPDAEKWQERSKK